MGVLLAFLTGTGYGLWEYVKLKRRSDALERLVRLCEQMAERIRYTAAPLEELLSFFSTSSEWQGFCLFRGLPATSSTEDWRAAWLKSVTQSAGELGLTEEEQRLLCEFTTDFGRNDLEGEIQRCRRYATTFRERCASAQNDVRCRGRLYITLGFCGGSALALLLI